MNKEKLLEITTPYEEHLKEALADPEESIGYLIAAFDEYQKDGELEVLLLAIQDICQAQRGAIHEITE